MAVQVPEEGFTAGMAGRLRYCQMVGREWLCKYLEKSLLQEWQGGQNSGRRGGKELMYKYLEKVSLQDWLGGGNGGRRGGREWLYRYLEVSLQERLGA